jgi:hypothetical protein
VHKDDTLTIFDFGLRDGYGYFAARSKSFRKSIKMPSKMPFFAVFDADNDRFFLLLVLLCV